MTPAEIEAEAERLFKAWASTLVLPADWKLPGEVTRAAWLAVAEASLAARASLTDAQVEGFAQTAVDDICKGFERPRNAIARAIRAALNAAAQPLQRKDNPATPAADDDNLNLGDVEAGDRDRDALAKAHRRIAALPEEKRHEAARRLSRSYSAPPPFVSQPDIPVEGHRDGLSWGRIDVSEHAPAWRVLMTTEPVSVSYGASPFLRADTAVFQRHRFRGTDAAVFVHDGLDVERVAAVLPVMLGGAS